MIMIRRAPGRAVGQLSEVLVTVTPKRTVTIKPCQWLLAHWQWQGGSESPGRSESAWVRRGRGPGPGPARPASWAGPGNRDRGRIL